MTHTHQALVVRLSNETTTSRSHLDDRCPATVAKEDEGVSVVDEDGERETHCSWRRRTLTRWHSPCRHGQRFRPHSTHTQLLLFRERTCARASCGTAALNLSRDLSRWQSATLHGAHRNTCWRPPRLSDIPSYCFWLKSHLSPLAFLFLAEKMSFVHTAWVPLKFVFQEFSRVHTTRRKSLYWAMLSPPVSSFFFIKSILL